MSQYQSSVSGPTVPGYDKPMPVTAGADLRQGSSRSVITTLVLASNVYTATLPTTVRGIVVYPTVADVWFAVGENPAAATTISGNVVAANFTVGQLAPFGIQTVRILDDYVASANASLRLISATANANVTISTF